MKYRISLFVALMLVANASIKAQPNDSLSFNFTLKEAVDYALNHQSAVLNAKVDEEIASNTVKQTIGIGLPNVSTSLSFQDFLKVPTSLLPGEFFGQPGTQIPVQFGVKYQGSAGIQVDQLLFDGTYLVGLQASKTYKELSARNSARTRIETAVAVTKAYYSVLVSNEQLTLIDANLTQLRKSLNDTEVLFKNGFAERIDVDRLQVLKNNLETERENVIRLLALNVDLLKFQMGMPVQAMLTLEDKISNVDTQPASVLVADTTVYKSRIEYSLLETQRKLNELDLKRLKSQFLPTIRGFASTSKSYQSNSFSNLLSQDFPTSVIGLNFSWTLINGGQRLFQTRNAKLAIIKTDNDIYNLKNVVSLEVSQSQKLYANSLQSVENQKRNLGLAQEILRVSRIKYEQGIGSSLEVTTAETSLKEAQNNYITALYDMLINKVNLDKATGKINY
ncbi:MAG TPA: TolC family protein [Sphingobacteriaceae bacterium]